MMESTETQGSERRRAPRAWVPGLAVLTSGTQPPSVWRVSNLSTGGVGLVGDGRLETGRHTLALHVAGFAPLSLEVNVLRRQLMTRGGRCGIRFVDLDEGQRRTLHEMTAASHAPPLAKPRAIIVAPDEARGTSLRHELALLGFDVRSETSPGQAGAWLQLEETDALFVDESAVEADRWSLLQFARDTAASASTTPSRLASSTRSSSRRSPPRISPATSRARPSPSRPGAGAPRADAPSR
jgi:hypothetical protein